MNVGIKIVKKKKPGKQQIFQAIIIINIINIIMFDMYACTKKKKINCVLIEVSKLTQI